MIRPYKNIDEFLDRTKIKLGSTFFFYKLKNDDYIRQVMLIGTEEKTNSVCFSGSWYTLEHLSNGYMLSLDGKTYSSIGVVEQDPAQVQFHVGEYYGLTGSDSVWKVTARYEDNGNTYVVFSNEFTEKILIDNSTDDEPSTEYIESKYGYIYANNRHYVAGG